MRILPLDNPFHQAPVYLFDEVDSTMETARELYRETGLPGIIAVTRHQRSGRGRIQRRVWHDSPGQSLLMTLVLERDDLTFPPEQLPLRTGIAVSRLLERAYDIASRIKWPNDILIGEGKVCGILCESTGRLFMIGIGLNVNQAGFPPAPEGEPYRREPVSIRMVTGSPAEPIELLEPLLSSLAWAFSLEDWHEYIETRLYRFGEEITLEPGEAAEPGKDPDSDRLVTGILAGLDPHGGIVLETGDGTTVWYSGEYRMSR